MLSRTDLLGEAMKSAVQLALPLARLADHTGPSLSQPWLIIGCYDEVHEEQVRGHLRSWNLPVPSVDPRVAALVKNDIVNHRVARTAACRVIEFEVSKLMAKSSLLAAVIQSLFTKLHRFFEAVNNSCPCWMPQGINVDAIKCLRDHGNARQ